MSGPQEHVPHTSIDTGYRSGQWYEEASARAELVNPALLNFRGPRRSQEWHRRNRQPSGCHRRKRLLRLRTRSSSGWHALRVQRRPRCRTPCRLGKGLGDDGCVVPDATTDVEKTFTRYQVERIEPSRERTWLAVVDSSGSIDGHKHVVVYMVGVAVRRITVRQIGQHKNFPRTWPDEVFSGNRCEGTHERRRPQAYRLAKSLRESHAYAFQLCCHC